MHSPTAPTSRSLSLGIAILLAVLGTRADGAPVTASYAGHVTVAAGKERGTAVATLATAGRRMTGSLSLAFGNLPGSGTYALSGRQRGPRVVLLGAGEGGIRLRWRGRWVDATTLRGRVTLRVSHRVLRGVLAITQQRGASPRPCDDYFTGTVMPRVLVPICARCHVPGGLAAGARLRVTVDDPGATRDSVQQQIDTADPPASRILHKPLGELGHGGGMQLAPDSAELGILRHWVELATQASCGGAAAGGTGAGTGGGGARTGAALYTDQCSSCHGADAGGLDGRPDIRCAVSIHDTVRNGRTGAIGTMPAFPALSDPDIALIQAWLAGLCPAPTGADVFASNCASCHGTDARGLDGSPDVHCNRAIHDTVRNGRTGAIGVMPAFPALSDADIAAVQDFLGTLCPAPSGADLFRSNCAACHGPDATGLGGLPDVHCARDIHDMVRNGRSGAIGTMPAFPALTDADIAALQAFLLGLCPAPTGTDLYVSNCAVCHGADARGLDGQPNVRCNGAIHDVVRGGRSGAIGVMPAFPALSDADIAGIQTYLQGLCGAHASGDDLYAGNCATCHGPDAAGGRDPGGVRGPDIRCTEIGDYLAAVRFGNEGMPAFPALDDAAVRRIVTWVQRQFCTGG